jgi:carboxylesterase
MPTIIPGAEPWSADGGDVGVLVLHGYTGNPVSVRPLAEAIAAAGYAVELPRLPGHGTSWQELARTTWRDWAREAVAAYEVLRARTRVQVLVGLSFGGALALYLAETRPDDLAGAVVINPSVWTGDWRAPLRPILKLVLTSVAGVGNDIAKPGADEKPYPRNPVRSAASMVDMQKLVRRNLARVTTPLLVLTSRQDHVVEPRNSELVLAGVSSTDTAQVWLEESYHVATLDYDAARIEQEALAFIKRVTGG